MEGPVVVNILNAIVERICGTCLPWLCNATVPQPGGPQTGKASFQTLAQSGARFGVFQVQAHSMLFVLTSQFEFSGVSISVCPFECAFMGYREMLVSQRIQSGIGTPTIAENLGTSSNVLLNNIRFPEITGEDNLTVFSYSGRVKSPESRWQRRRADLRHFEIFRHGPVIIYTRLPAGETYYPICTFYKTIPMRGNFRVLCPCVRRKFVDWDVAAATG